jgi:hypothetical protein
MWLNVQWYDSGGGLLAEDGAYGPLTVQIDGAPTQVESLVDLHDPYVPVFEAHGAMTREWAGQLLSLGKPASLPLSFDRLSGAVAHTLGELGGQGPGTHLETFHFVLNNFLAKDNRIPPYGMGYDQALARNLVPVPAAQYGDPGPGGTYEHWSEVALNPPPGADHATVRLLYQPTSWEYVQFLYLANEGQNAFLADEGSSLLDAWIRTGMAAPYAMATDTTWQPTTACADGLDNDRDGLIDYPDDPGCAAAEDASENSTSPCDDRVDSDGDGLRDFPADPGCRNPLSLRENPQCDDDVDNDGDGTLDWDGGADGGTPDPQCTAGWINREKASGGGRCGLGLELALAVPALLVLRRVRRRVRG